MVKFAVMLQEDEYKTYVLPKSSFVLIEKNALRIGNLRGIPQGLTQAIFDS